MHGQVTFRSAISPGHPIHAITTAFTQTDFTTGFIVTFLGFELAGDENHPVRNDSLVVSSPVPDCGWLYFNAGIGVIG
jgi:hypothetical protein